MFTYSHAVGGTFWRRFTIKLSYFKQKYGHKKQLALFTVFPAPKSGNVSFHNLPCPQKRVYKSWQPASRKPKQELRRRAGACNKKQQPVKLSKLKNAPVYRTHLPQLLLLTFCHAAGAEHTVPEKQSQEFPEKIISLVNGE